METKIDNRRAYELNKSINHDLNAICQPFMNISGVSNIAYHKIYSNGKAISLCTQEEVIKHYLLYVQKNGLFFQKHLKEIPENKFFYFLWPNKIENSLQEIMCQLDVWNGFNIYIKHSDYIENFVLTTSPNNTEVQSYCINNLNLINYFICYFKERAYDFIYKTNEKDMAFFNNSENWKVNNQECEEISFLHLKKIPFYVGKDLIYLTNQEALCLSYLGCGYSAKEISLKLKISPRTVESYLSNIRSKSGVFFKSEFFALIESVDNSIVKNFKSIFEHQIYKQG